jgi:hypothetical protein
MASGFNWDKARMSSLVGGRGYEDITAASRKRQEDEDHKKWLKKMRKRAKALKRSKESPSPSIQSKNQPKTNKLPMGTMADFAKRVQSVEDSRSPLLRTTESKNYSGGLKSAFHHQRVHNIIDSDELPWEID